MGNAASIGGYGYPVRFDGSIYGYANTRDRLIEGDAITEGIIGNAYTGHEISKRSPVSPFNPFVPLWYASCATGTKIGAALGTGLTAGVGKLTLPVLLPAFLGGLCPKVSLAIG